MLKLQILFNAQENLLVSLANACLDKIKIGCKEKNGNQWSFFHFPLFSIV